MSYRKHTIPHYKSSEGFDKISNVYHQYRSHLNSIDHDQFIRYLPRTCDGLNILDIGAGDGRTFHHFQKYNFAQYIAIDSSQGMLDRFKDSRIQKIVADCSTSLPLESESIDLALSFFFFEYIETLTDFFVDVYRVLEPWGTFVSTYFHQRNWFVRWHGSETFKIIRKSHTYDDIKKAAEYAFFTREEIPLIDQGKVVGYIYVFSKK